MVGKLYKNAVFCDYLAIPEGKGGCYMAEICNWRGSDVLRGT